MNRVHWPSLILTLLFLLLAIWAVVHMPIGPEYFCEKEWFPEIGMCL